MKKIFLKYGHALFALYIFIYLPWFVYLEGLTDIEYNVIHCFIDDYIPFCEVFIIPYIIWFFYIILTCIFMYFKAEKGEFLKFAVTLVLGMTIAMIICTFYPNCVDMRPTNIARDNIFMSIVRGLHNVDTSTNVFPSVHVLNSIVACVALSRHKYFKKHKFANCINIFICFMICLSTVFLKQHSVIDGISSAILYLIMYAIIYVPKWKLFSSSEVLFQ